MKLGKHQKTEEGLFRKERPDSSTENLRKEYLVLNNLHGNIKTLGVAEKAHGVDSLSQVLKEAKKLK